jgi:hypothetical protein
MRGFGIEGMAEVFEGMNEFFVLHGIEETFDLRVNSSDVAQKVKVSFDSMQEELKKIIDEAPANCREEIQSMVDGDDIPTLDSFYSQFRQKLRENVYITLKSLTVTAENMGLEGGYDDLIKIPMPDVLNALMSDQKIDALLKVTKNIVISDILKKAVAKAALMNLRTRFGGAAPMPFGLGGLMPFGFGGPMPFGSGDLGHGMSSDKATAGLDSLFSAFKGIDDDIDDSDEEGEEEESESDDDGDPFGFGGIIF